RMIDVRTKAAPAPAHRGVTSMTRSAKHWIDGEWRTSEDGASGESINPGTGEVLGRFESAGLAEAQAAIAAARRVFDRGLWPHQPRVRAQVLLEFAGRLEAVKPELAKLLSQENGKLIGDCMHEVAGAVSELQYYAGLARNLF